MFSSDSGENLGSRYCALSACADAGRLSDFGRIEPCITGTAFWEAYIYIFCSMSGALRVVGSQKFLVMCEFASAVLQYKGLLAQYSATKPQICNKITLDDNVYYLK